jgi:hypothetical protein
MVYFMSYACMRNSLDFIWMLQTSFYFELVVVWLLLQINK